MKQKILPVALGLAFFLTALPALAQSPNFDDWLYSMPLRLNTTTTGANVTGDLPNFPVLIRLNASNFNFDQPKADGTDLRFSRNIPGVGKVELARHIERWDKTNKVAELWVLVDEIKGNNGDQAIILHWGNLSAPAAPLTQVFPTSQDYSGVWHMDAAGTSITEVSQGRHGTKGPGTKAPSSTTSGIIGHAQTFDGSEDYASLPGNTNWVNSATEVTLQAWIRWEGTETTGGAKIVGVTKNGGDNSRAQLGFDYQPKKIKLEARSDDPENLHSVQSTATLNANTWYHVVGIIKYGTVKTMTICVNGVCETPSNAAFTHATLPSTNSTYGAIGVDESVVAGNNASDGNFHGKIDEVRLSRVARSTDWVKLSYENQNANQKLVQFQSQFLPVAGGGVFGDVDLNGYYILNAGMVVTRKWKVPPPDYVFEPGYELPELAATAKYIKEHRHLPGIPSAREMESDGLDLATMNLQLLKQVEHMQLYILHQEKRIKKLEGIEVK